jgi:hypothetical protein
MQPILKISIYTKFNSYIAMQKLLLFSAIVMLACCKQVDKKNNKIEDDIKLNSSLTGKVKTQQVGQATIKHIYDNNGKLVKTDDGDTNFTEFTYTNVQIRVKQYSFGGHLQIDQIMELNKQGLVTKSADAARPEKSYTTYEYDDKGHLIKQREYTEGIEIEEVLTINWWGANGNLDSSYVYKGADIIKEQKYFTYYRDKANSIAAENLGYVFAGVTSKNPILEEKTIRHSSTIETRIEKSEYAFDDNGRITKRIVNEKDGTEIFTIQFTYY